MSTRSASPFSIHVRDLRARAGEEREVHLDFELPDHFGEGVIRVPAGERIELDARLESLHEGIYASGTAETIALGECVRCLDEMRMPLRVDFGEVFAYSQDEAFDGVVTDDRIDLEPVVRDAVVLALPFQPVCREDCFGLDPNTGEKLQAAPDDAETRSDPRWAALQGFESNDDAASRQGE